MSDSVVNNLWVEKYRPKTIDDVVLPDAYSIFFKDCIQNKSIPNLMFIGGAGCGKSTVARILIDYIIGIDRDAREMDLLEINGSSSTGVETVRNVITDFIKMPVIGSSKTKIVYIDEFDYFSQNAQAALRNIMEEYSNICRFIFTLNFRHKILEAIISRSQVFEFSTNMSRDSVTEYIQMIIKKELGDEDYKEIIKSYVSKYYPDIRRIVNTVQTKVIDGKLKDNIVNSNKAEEEIINIISLIGASIKEKNLTSINNYIKKIQNIFNDPENDVDYMNLYQSLFDSDNLSFSSKFIVGKFCNEHHEKILPQMHFICMILQLVETSFAKMKSV